MWWFDVIKNVMQSTVPGEGEEEKEEEEKEGFGRDPKADQSSQGHGHCDLPIGARHPSSSPSPVQFRLGSWAEIFLHSLQDLAKAVNSELHACAKRKRAL